MITFSFFSYTNGGKAYGSESDYGSDYGNGQGNGNGQNGGGGGEAPGSHRGSEYQVGDARFPDK